MLASTSRARAIRLIAACSAVLLGVGYLGCGGGSDQVVARVAGSPIYMQMLSHWTSVVTTAAPDPAGPATPSKARALDFLIAAQWLVQEAHNVGVRVTAAESEKQLELLRFDQVERLSYAPLPKDTELRGLLMSSRVARADRLWLMRLSLLSVRIEGLRLSQARRNVTPQQIATYYREHRRSFVQREWRELEIIGNFHKAVVAKAKREVEAGANFLSVARRVSVDSEAPRGLQSLYRGQEEPPFEKVVFAAKPGVLEGPTEYGFFYIFKVLRAKPERRLTLAESEARIRRLLGGQQASGPLLPALEREWISRTRCVSGVAASRCRK
jgi:hypothetical protein